MSKIDGQLGERDPLRFRLHCGVDRADRFSDLENHFVFRTMKSAISVSDARRLERRLTVVGQFARSAAAEGKLAVVVIAAIVSIQRRKRDRSGCSGSQRFDTRVGDCITVALTLDVLSQKHVQ